MKGEELFNILLPHSEAWRSGRVESPREFATPTLFESVFSELLFCKRMHVATFECPLDRPFLSLPAVRECSELHVERAHRNLTLTEVTEWLNVDSTSSEPRRMRVSSDVCDFVVTDLLHLLKAVGVGFSVEQYSGFSQFYLYIRIPGILFFRKFLN